MTSLTTPDSPPAGASTKPQLLFLGLGLLSFAVLWAAPVALAIWLLGWFFGSVGIAEALERTRGLAPTTYGGAFWLAVIITLAMVALEVRAMIRKDPARRSWLLRFITRPSTAYFPLIVPTVLLVRIDMRGTDVPDIITTTLLLCCLGYVWFILPLAMAAVSWRLTWWMWRKGSGSSFAAGVLGMLGLSFASCMPLVCVVDDDEHDEQWPMTDEVGKAFARGFDRAKGQDAIDGSRALMGALAEVNEPSSTPTSETSKRYTTHECMEKLVEPENGGPSRLTKVIRKLRRDYENRRIEVEDLVYWKMIDICVDEPRRDDKKLFGLLLAASRNGLADIYRHGEVEAKWKPVLTGYRARCLIDASDEVEESYEDRQHRLVTAVEALATLHPDDRALLDEHYLEQLPYAEMARRRGIREGTVAKATNRTVHTMRTWLANRCH